MFRFAIPAALLLTAGASTAGTDQGAAERDRARLERALAGLTPGAPVRCLPRDRVTQLRTFANTILFVQGRNRLWRNDGCEGVRRDDILVTRTTLGQYCAGDLIETHARAGGHFTGACSLGEFVPYTKQEP